MAALAEKDWEGSAWIPPQVQRSHRPSALSTHSGHSLRARRSLALAPQGHRGQSPGLPFPLGRALGSLWLLVGEPQSAPLCQLPATVGAAPLRPRLRHLSARRKFITFYNTISASDCRIKDRTARL